MMNLETRKLLGIPLGGRTKNPERILRSSRGNVLDKDRLVCSRYMPITIRGVTKPAHEWCEIYDLSLSTWGGRIRMQGVDPVTAMTAPRRRAGGPTEKAN